MSRLILRMIAARKRREVTAGLAVVLAVAFISGSLVLRDTVTSGFTQTLADTYADTDAVVRARTEVGREESAERPLLDRSLSELLAGVDGVDAVVAQLHRDGRIIGADGDPVGGSGRTIAGNWVGGAHLNPYSVVQGRAPVHPGEVVIDEAAAEEGNLRVGDATYLRTPDRVDVTIVGIVRFGTQPSRGADTFAAFADEVAAQVLVPDPQLATAIVVSARPGVDRRELVHRISAVLPEHVEAITGDVFMAELEDEIQGEDHEVFQQALLLFALLTLVVAAFSIYNTFSILVVHRARESALLRALGASRAQVFAAVAAEALVLATVASVLGVVVGVALTAVLLPLMGLLGLAVPASSPSPRPATIGVAFVVGISATMASSLAPSVRASRVAPLAALRAAAGDAAGTSRRRTAAGAVTFGAGVVFLVAGAINTALEVAGLGALSTVTGVLIAAPAVMPRAATVLGVPLRRWLGPGGVMATHNATRNPRRAAATTMPLVLGVAVVVLFAVAGASVKKSIADAVDRQFTSDLVIIGEGRGGLSVHLADAVAQLPEVAAASPSGGAPIRVDGVGTLATTLDPGTVLSVTDLHVRHGSLPDLRPDQVALSAGYASDRGLALGDALTIDYPDGTTQRLTVGAIYEDDDLSEDVGIRLPRDTYLAHTPHPVDVNMQIALADGVTLADGEAAVQQVADRFGAPDVQTNEEFTAAISAEIDAYLTVIYLLLVLTIVIALLGIASTLSLAIHERTPEIGLLRAVGQTRSQARAMIRAEAVLTAIAGTAAGTGIGVLLGWSIVSALADDGLRSFAVPGGTIAVTIAAGALAGVGAAAGPARRAANMDALAAIAMQ